MRTAVYPPSRIVGNPSTNENSPFQIALESSRIPGLYKPAVPDHQQDTQARTFRANSSGSGPSSPPYLLPYSQPFSGRPSGSIMTGPTREAGEALRSGSGILYRCSRVFVAQTRASPWTPPYQSQPPSNARSCHPLWWKLEALSSPRRLLHQEDVFLGNADATAQPRYSGQPNAHLHGGIGVTKSHFL